MHPQISTLISELCSTPLRMLRQTKNRKHRVKDDNFHSNPPFSPAKERNFQIFVSLRDRKMRGQALIKKEGEGFSA